HELLLLVYVPTRRSSDLLAEDRDGAGGDHRVDRRDERERWDDHLVAAPDADRGESGAERSGSARHRNGMRDLEQLAEAVLERFRSEEHTSELQSRSDLVC